MAPHGVFDRRIRAIKYVSSDEHVAATYSDAPARHVADAAGDDELSPEEPSGSESKASANVVVVKALSPELAQAPLETSETQKPPRGKLAGTAPTNMPAPPSTRQPNYHPRRPFLANARSFPPLSEIYGTPASSPSLGPSMRRRRRRTTASWTVTENQR
ncbi:MAG: hypothetical protein Q9177_006751 [Variospora cf. flavescens]